VHSIVVKCLTMWHKNYPRYIMYANTLPCKVMTVKIIVTEHCVISHQC